MIQLLTQDSPFPPLQTALREPNGLLAVGGDLSLKRLIDAYTQGIFPWYSAGDPVLWWSPDPRMVLIPGRLKVSRSLGKTLRKGHYQIRTDTAFRDVMQACAAPRPDQDGTWISAEVIEGYCRLHQAGLAHSVETWMDGELVGGLYGVALGRMFYGESMFSRRTDASKLAFVYLVKQLQRWNFGLIDCQMKTAHLASLGAHEIPRSDFAARLGELVTQPGLPGKWIFEDDLVQPIFPS